MRHNDREAPDLVKTITLSTLLAVSLMDGAAATLAFANDPAPLAPPAVRAQAVNPQAAALKEFGNRTREYMELHNRLAATLPSLSGDATPEEIERHKEALASAIRKARAKARQGEIFIPAIVQQFRSIIASDLRSRDTRDALAAMQDVPVALKPRLHDRWPPNAARATVPPRLLNNLYRLPEGLEYRFIGRHLVLMDLGADLIVDYISNVVPSTIRRR
jgi:hypothetical protein